MRTLGANRKVDFHTKLMDEREIKLRVMSADSFGKILNEGDTSDKALQEAYIIGCVMIAEVKHFRELLSQNPNMGNVMEDFNKNTERIKKLYGDKIDKLISKTVVEVYEGKYGEDNKCDAVVVEKVLEQIGFYKDEDLVWIALYIGYTMEYIMMQERLKKVYN